MSVERNEISPAAQSALEAIGGSAAEQVRSELLGSSNTNNSNEPGGNENNNGGQAASNSGSPEPPSGESILSAVVKEKAAQAAAQGANQQQAPENKPAEGGNEAGEQNANTAEQTELETPLGKIKVGGQENKVKGPALEIPESTAKYIKEKFGIEKADKFFESTEKWRADSQALPEIKSKYENLVQVFEKMPENLYAATEAWLQGQDPDAAFNARPKFDYAVDPEKQDPKLLVNTYFPDQFTEDEWKEYNDPDGDKSIKKGIDIALSQSREKYAKDRTKFSDGRALTQKQASERMEMLKSTATSSVSHMKSVLPDLPDSLSKDIESVLSSGNIASLIYDEKGAVRKEAALGLAMFKHGHEVIQQISRIAENKAKTDIREEVITRTADSPEQRGSSANAGIRPEVLKFIEEVVPGAKRK